MTGHVDLAVIGGGPAGLAAAEAAAQHGLRVTLFDAKPSVGRKFLIAGKSGLNLTFDEPLPDFVRRYHDGGPQGAGWADLLEWFGPDEIRSWARDLGIDTFAARTGRVYPEGMKAAPLLRRWIERLRTLGVTFAMRHRWISLAGGSPWTLGFDDQPSVTADAVVFALGGASWPQTGSDGRWRDAFNQMQVACAPIEPANCGWETDWPASVTTAAEGLPLKNISVEAGGERVAGELLITRYGLEGGAIYQLGHRLRRMARPAITVDLKPTFTADELARKLNPAFSHLLEQAILRWKLSPAAAALLATTGASSPHALAQAAKHFVIPLTQPRPVEEAISSAGGVRWNELDPSLMLRRHPGCFVAGEMIDWEAPTGGYLLHGCIATGRRAGHAAARWLNDRNIPG